MLTHGSDLLVAAHGYRWLRALDLALMFHGPWLQARQWAPLQGISRAGKKDASKWAGVAVHAVAETADSAAAQLLEKLLAAGADANRKRLSVRGETALHVARTGRVAELLLTSAGRSVGAAG